ncbi:ammonium transporter [Anaeromyxobacter paludicola]|uniref:Ammonium transporter n=1 Tax=Anaeromyxobacter paludicola TaxID=2918171 RepID=A0ABM7X7P9_9BACT|nr:ammonium transporter [Anaeromyxobacter paludicola]BDG07859.1 ammonium transporter [Anaeromyxobacter paludicola]
MNKIATFALGLALPALALATPPGQVDSGDTALVLVSAGLVLLMTPGLAFFYGGLVRAKNVVHTMILSLVCMAVVGVLWMALSYSLSFSPGYGPLDRFVGGLSWLGLRGVGGEVAKDLAPTVPHAAFMLFQAMFAVITPALISGALVERVRVKAFVLFVAIWSVVVYTPVAHWVWAPGGWLRQLGVLDFAGGTVVHINAAVAALVGAMVVGRRRGLRQPTVLPHNVPFAILGAGLLWFGWLGFNGGSALGANGLAAYAFSNTFFAPAAAAAAWGLAELFLFHGKMSGVGLASGAVAGMVAITPAAGYVTPFAATLIGAIAALASLTAVRYRPRLGLDDSLDVFAVHGVAATLGALLTGIFATKGVNPDAADGSLRLLGLQALGVGVTMIWSGALSYGIFKLVGAVTPLRADDQDEWSGMDMSESGERAYISSDLDSGSSDHHHHAAAASPARAELHAAAK